MRGECGTEARLCFLESRHAVSNNHGSSAETFHKAHFFRMNWSATKMTECHQSDRLAAMPSGFAICITCNNLSRNPSVAYISLKGQRESILIERPTAEIF